MPSLFPTPTHSQLVTLLTITCTCIAIITAPLFVTSTPTTTTATAPIIDDGDEQWYTSSTIPAFSPSHPVTDLGMTGMIRTTGIPRASLYRSTAAPLATNKFFMNIVLGSGSGSENTLDILPYIIQATSSVNVFYPNVLQHGSGQYQNVWDPVYGSIAMGSVETDLAGTSHQLSTHDEVSATLMWSYTGAAASSASASASASSSSSSTDTGVRSNDGRMQSSLVRGSPYVTMSYASLTPLIATRQSLVRLLVDGSEYACDGRLLPSARRWTFHLRQFDQSWQLWSSQPIRLRCEASPPTTTAPTPTPATPSLATNPIPVPTPSPAPIRELRTDKDDPATPEEDDTNDDDSDEARNAFIHEPIMANAGFVLQGTSSFVGTLRLALINNCTSGTNTLWCPPGTGSDGIDQSSYASLLDHHHQTVVTGATLKYYWHDDGDDTTVDDAGYAFDWNTMALQNAHLSLLNDINTATLMAAPIRSSQTSSAASAAAAMSSLSMKRTCDTHRSSGAAIPLATAMAMLGIDLTAQQQMPIISAATTATTNGNDASVEPPQPLAAPLLFALPHHIAAFTSQTRSSIGASGNHRNIRGLMIPVISSQWRFSQSLTNIGLRASRPISSSYIDDVRSAVRADSNYDLPLNYRSGTGDVYFAGKMLARMARIILIADELHLTDIVDHLVPRLRNYTDIWLHGLSRNRLVYDSVWGGIITCGCRYDDGSNSKDGSGLPFCTNDVAAGDCPAITDPGFDFGNGYYNDHHLQYGYHIYAAAVVAKYDASFIRQSGEYVMALIRSIANPSSHDRAFPMFRHMDWYAGHSWAGGIPQPFQLGRNQESSSEALNAWYAIYLYGMITNQPLVKNVGRLLLSVELRSVQMYWHIPDDSPVYPSPLWPNRMVGIIWSNLAQYSTWFGSAAYEVHGIQMLPITPITELLLPPSFAALQWRVFDRACSTDDQCRIQGWHTLTICNQAIDQRDDAWTRAQALTDDSFDNVRAGGNGNSRSNTLYWIATR